VVESCSHNRVEQNQSSVKTGHGDMSPTNVQINIYNVLGQKVRSLVNEEHPAGEYTVVWDGRDDNGRSVSSGVYFGVMRAGGDQSVRRMVLLK